MPVTVLIVDDHAPFRAVARAMFEQAGYRVIGEAGDGASAIEAAGALHPSLVLLDIALPDGNGFDVCELITGGAGRWNAPAVVLTSSRDETAFADRLGATSAKGFVPKSRLSVAAVIGLLP